MNYADDSFLKPKNNSIGFVRLLLASCVLWGHGCELAGYKIDTNRWGVLAVLGFFTLSGMLVTQSFQHSKSLVDFLWRRALRVYPGYWANLVMTAFVLIPALWMLTKGSLDGYFASDASPYFYVWRAAPIVNGFVGDIRHVFFGNPLSQAVNGSLWTLPVEVFCYVMLGIFAWLGAIRRPILAPILAVAFTVLWMAHLHLDVPRNVQKLFDPLVIELYAAFSIGVTFYLYRSRLRLIPWLGWLCVAFCGVILWNHLGSVGDALRPIATAYAVLWLAAWLPFRHFDRKIDLSYGVYIYAYPIQQSLILLGVSRSSPPLYFGLTVILTAALATFSWFLIERPALRFKRAFAPKKPRPEDEQIATVPA